MKEAERDLLLDILCRLGLMLAASKGPLWGGLADLANQAEEISMGVDGDERQTNWKIMSERLQALSEALDSAQNAKNSLLS